LSTVREADAKVGTVIVGKDGVCVIFITSAEPEIHLKIVVGGTIEYLGTLRLYIVIVSVGVID
jgi:hypothetical protein